MGKKTDEIVHWSKDFVEHLRTVHFALVVLGVGLIIVATTQRNPTVARAIDQLDHITALVDGLNGNWIERYCLELKGALLARQPKNGSDAVGAKRVVLALAGADNILLPEIQNECLVAESDPRKKVDSLVLQPESNRHLVFTRVNTELIKMGPPQTIGEFAKIWDAIDRNPQVVLPISLGDEFYPEKPENGSLKYTMLTSAEETNSNKQTSWTKAEFEIRTALDGGKQYSFVYRDKSRALSVPVTQIDFESLDLLSLFRKLQPESPQFHWRPGSFAESFPGLSEFSKDRDSATFADLGRALQTELNRGGESFEAFGLKVPSQTITLWGTILLLGVQFYFLTHLMELTRRLLPTDPGWEVAWVGVYRGVLARVLLVISAILLPIAAVVVLGVKAIAITGTKNVWIASIAGMVASAALGFLIARHLPQSGE
jgi:hypothetical protein